VLLLLIPLLLLAFLIALPILALIVRAIGNALHPLPNTPPPYHQLPPPSGTVPAGDLVVDGNQTGNFEIYLMTPQGKLVRRLTDDPQVDSWWARISPDRQHILFYRSPRRVHDTNAGDNSLWVMDADGSHAIDIRPKATNGWRVQGHAEWSPNGKQLVMIGGSATNSQIYVTSSTGQDPVDVTHHRSGSNIDPSWLPDGSGILFVGCPSFFCTSSHQEVYRLSLAPGSKPVRLTHDGDSDYDPYASPSGKQVAWLRQTAAGHPGQWNIMMENLNGTDQRDLTDSPDVNSKPSWSRDGQLIYFHRLVHGQRSYGFTIWSIRPNGTDLHEILAIPGHSVEYPGT
jgi:Tol biopolymer transport system component